MGSRVPDYRGIFLRGHGSQTSTHYGTVTHASAGLGQLQGDAVRRIWGAASQLIFDDEDSIALQGVFSHTGIDWHNPVSSGDYMMKGVNLDLDISRVVPVDNEIRPANRAVRYLIRAR